MANVFNKIADIKNNVKRNSFDWSHDNNFTTDLGRITPVFTELVPPNSSVRIKPEFGLRFMPMMFPIQTKMKAYLSFFKVPLRTLWSDYMDFISADNSQEYQPPYIKFPRTAFNEGKCLSPSGLGDYFGIPVSRSSTDWVSRDIFTPTLNTSKVMGHFYLVQRTTENQPYSATRLVWSSQNAFTPTVVDGSAGSSCTMLAPNPGSNILPVAELAVANNPAVTLSTRIRLTLSCVMRCNDGDVSKVLTLRDIPRCNPNPFGFCILTRDIKDTEELDGRAPIVVADSSVFKMTDPVISTGSSNTFIVSGTLEFSYMDLGFASVPSKLYLGFCTPNYASLVDEPKRAIAYSSCVYWPSFESSVSYLTLTSSTPSSGDVVGTPYYSDNNTDSSAIKVSAYPFRAYEAIYNAYIRNTRNNPFVLNGKKTYNKWITTDAGGQDTLTPLDLLYANWQSDAYTTALQAPQQGTAPLVGLTSYETRSLNDAGHEVTTINTAIIDEDGNAYKVDFESNGEALKGVNYTPLKAGELVNPQALVSPVTSGISINDFRNVNAYQRYLELNQFRGFSYKEIIEGRFDVNVRYDALNMPEYLGGITRDIVVNPITQTVETSNDGSYVGSLGSQAGLATCFGNSDGSISVFCDEESIVMGIMYVMPMPVYDSLLPKWLTYRERLDSFNPEFDHIGYQPIYVKELAALQAYESGTDLDTVFGYQRPWYEYVQKPDRAHGLFLSSLRNFIMFRSFSDVPELGKSFTVMQPGSVNNVFTVTEVSDKILGQIHFNCTAQLPISRVVVPRLE